MNNTQEFKDSTAIAVVSPAKTEINKKGKMNRTIIYIFNVSTAQVLLLFQIQMYRTSSNIKIETANIF